MSQTHTATHTYIQAHACAWKTQTFLRKWGPIRCNKWQISKKHKKKFNALKFFNWFFLLISSPSLSLSISQDDFWALWDWQNKRDCCGDTNYLMNSLFILKVPWVAMCPDCYSRWKITDWKTVSDTWTEAEGQGVDCAIQTCPCP